MTRAEAAPEALAEAVEALKQALGELLAPDDA
jgi:hypothetical protein